MALALTLNAFLLFPLVLVPGPVGVHLQRQIQVSYAALLGISVFFLRPRLTLVDAPLQVVLLKPHAEAIERSVHRVMEVPRALCLLQAAIISEEIRTSQIVLLANR